MQDKEVIMLIKDPTRNIIIMELWSKQHVGNFCFVSRKAVSPGKLILGTGFAELRMF